MQHVRFYQDFGDGPEGRRAKRNSWKNKKLAPNALALFLNDNGAMEALVAITNDADSHVAMDGVTVEYLRKHCKRCSEAVARKIHPNLFKRLEDDVEGPKKLQKSHKVGMKPSGAAGYGIDKYGADSNAKTDYVPPMHPGDVYKYDPR